jgi:hypothetical protein
LKIVISKYKCDGLSNELVCDCHDLAVLGICVEDVTNVLQLNRTDEELEDIQKDVAIKLYASNILNIKSSHLEEQSTALKSALDQLLTPLFCSSSGFKLFLQLLIGSNSTVVNESISSVLHDKLSSQSINIRTMLCEVPVELLCAASDKSEIMKKFYLDWLVMEGKEFIADFSCSVLKFKKVAGSINEIMTMNDLSRHFKALLKIPSLAIAVEILLNELSQKPGSSFWDELKVLLS